MSDTEYARAELARAGLFDPDGDYNGWIGENVMELIEVLNKQDHSGYTRCVTLAAFDRVARNRPLTPITSDPAEWNDVSGAFEGVPTWQSKRNPAVFSRDGGKTWIVNETEPALLWPAVLKRAPTDALIEALKGRGYIDEIVEHVSTAAMQNEILDRDRKAYANGGDS